MTGALGFCSRTGSAVAVAVATGAGRPTLAGRWTVDLTAPDVPWQLFHAAADLPPAEAETLVRTGTDAVTEVATGRVRELLAELETGPGTGTGTGTASGTGTGTRTGVTVAAVGVVTGDHPVPEAVPAILASHALMHAAEGQLYREALLAAVAACRLPAHAVPKARAAALLTGELAGPVAALGAGAGPPWRKEHKLAAVAALTAATR